MAMSVPLARAFPNEEHTASVSAGRKQAQRKAHERLSKQGVKRVNKGVLRGELFEGKGGQSSLNERRGSEHCSERLVKGSTERQDWLAKAGDCRKRSFSSSLRERYSAGVETRKGSPRRMEEWTKRKGWEESGVSSLLAPEKIGRKAVMSQFFANSAQRQLDVLLGFGERRSRLNDLGLERLLEPVPKQAARA